MVALGIMATALVSLAQLFVLSVRTNIMSHKTTHAAVLAEQKLEELRGLTWGFDPDGLPLSDVTTDTAVSPETPIGGRGLDPSPLDALQKNTKGYVDYVDDYGNKVGTGDVEPPDEAAYTRRWSITPLPTNPNNTLIIQVMVTQNNARGDANEGSVKRLPEEARMITVKTRKAQ